MSNVTNLAVVREARRQQDKPNSVGKGFALLHRKIMDLPFYKDPEAAHLWIHLILKAKHAPEMVMTDLGEKHVGRGQLLSGRNALAFETGLIPDRVKYLLSKYKKLGMIHWVSHGKFSIFTVTKYDDYQLNSVPADYQQITSPTPATTMPADKVVPADYHQITTDNELLNTNLISKDIKCASSAENPEKKKHSISCEQVVEVYRRVLPECQGINIITDKRRNLIRTFWQKAGKVTRKLDGHAFGLSDWEAYLTYISSNCRWMLENRPDPRTGKTWRKKALEYFLDVDVYAKTREGACDDL